MGPAQETAELLHPALKPQGTLAKLSERYGLMVMHWTRANVDTFTAHDDGITYRYRTSNGRSTENDRGTATVTATTAALTPRTRS